MSLRLSQVAFYINGRQLIKEISLEVKCGEVVGLLGPNGAGKTTTFSIAIGQLTPYQGEVFLDGKSITKLSMPTRALLGIGYLPQEASIFRELTVSENLNIPLEQFSSNKSHQRLRKEQLIKDFNLTNLLDRKGFQLSGGERRRCEVARALALGRKGPKYLLLDEPFAGVDPMAVNDLQNLIDQLRAKGIGVLITDHNVRETLAITDRSYILSEGKILSSGTSKEVANDPLVKRHYLGEGFKF